MVLEQISGFFKELQDDICRKIEIADGAAIFISDAWLRPEGGGGDTRILQNGAVLEKAGVNFSHVHGMVPEVLAVESRIRGHFHATGVSIVMHPYNPYVPIIHMNVRYFQLSDTDGGEIKDAWFGGGIDLSPAYPNEADGRFFHESLKAACDKFNPSYYPAFKAWCDEYFTIKHRNEMRGIGGIFFDHKRPGVDGSMEDLFSFVREVGNTFAPVYSELIRRSKDRTYSEKQKQWQYIRRGRYAEFNLVYDRGTSFGLKTNGRIESILMSLPPRAEWYYDHHPKPGSEEAEALEFFKPMNWA